MSWFRIFCTVAIFCGALEAVQKVKIYHVVLHLDESTPGKTKVYMQHLLDPPKLIWHGSVSGLQHTSDRVFLRITRHHKPQTLLVMSSGTFVFFPFELPDDADLHWAARLWRGNKYTIVTIDSTHQTGLWLGRSDGALIKLLPEFVPINGRGSRVSDPDEKTGDIYIPKGGTTISLTAIDSPKASDIEKVVWAPTSHAALEVSPFESPFEVHPWDGLRYSLDPWMDGSDVRAKNLLVLASVIVNPHSKTEHVQSAKSIFELLVSPTSHRQAVGLSPEAPLENSDYLLFARDNLCRLELAKKRPIKP